MYNELKKGVKEKIVGTPEYQQKKAMEEQMKYQKDMEAVAAKLIIVLREEKLNALDVNNVIKLIQIRFQQELNKVPLEYLLTQDDKKEAEEAINKNKDN